MRNSTPIVLWVLIFSFGVLWVLQDTQVFDAMAGGPANLGAVNGDAIAIEEYNQRVSYYVDQHNQQSASPMTSEIRNRYEEQAWEDLVAERLMEQRMAELGITVTDDELVNMITGDNPDPFIRQQFSDETGQIDRVALRAAIEAPENSEIWVMIEQQLRQNRQQQKMSNFIMSGLRVSNSDIRQAYRKENSYADIRFVRLPYSDIPNDDIQVTDQEISRYYDNNLDQFQREESYRFDYISFDIVATREDTLRFIQDVENLRAQFEETENHAQFLQQNESRISYADNFVHIDDIRDEFSSVIDLQVGEVSEVQMINGQPHMFKKVEQEGDEIKFAILSYEVIADPIATVDRLAEEAEEFSFYAQEEGFEQEAEMQGYEVRSATATRGTPVIAGLGEGRGLVDQLERMRRGNISGAIELADRFVVVQLREVTRAGTRPLSEVRPQIESRLNNDKRIEMTVRRAESFYQPGISLEDFAEAADRNIQTAGNVRLGANSITGAGREPGIIGAVFGLESGERTGILKGNSGAFMVEVSQVDLADPADMSAEDRNRLRQQLEQQKYNIFSEVWLDQMKKDANIRDNRHLIFSR